MSESSDQGEKVHDPTPQKLEDARKKGDIPRSMDVSAASAMIGLLIALSFSGAEISQSTGAALATVVERAHKLTGVILAPGGMELAMNWVQAAITPMLPIFLLPFGLAIASLVAQRAFAVSFEKIIPKFSRLGMISNAKQKFGPSGLVQFLKSTVKMVTIATVLIFYLMSKNDELIGSVHGNKHSVFALLGETLITITMASCVIFSLIGLIDLLWQRFDHARKLRMSFQDLKEEQKSAEGDPHTKAQRRQRGQEIATNRMMLDVPKADVIIVNPTHYAIALSWDRAPGRAPECVAKGTDEIAARIRETANEHGVPIHSDPPTARALYGTVEIGQEIEPKHYRAVAAAINFAEKIREKAKQGNGLGQN